MLNIKKTINFKTIRDKGPKSIDIKNDEVVQIVSSGKDILYVVTQDHLLQLMSAYNSLLVHTGHKKEEVVTIDISTKMKEMEKDLKKLLKIANEDKEVFEK